mgnify:CR=1 FL=1
MFGTEVKSIRQGTMHLKEAWCQIKDGELWIKQMHISPYEQGNIFKDFVNNLAEVCTDKNIMDKKVAEMHKIYQKTNLFYFKINSDTACITFNCRRCWMQLKHIIQIILKKRLSFMMVVVG